MRQQYPLSIAVCRLSGFFFQIIRYVGWLSLPLSRSLFFGVSIHLKRWTKNATTHLSIVVIHFVNSINTLMGTKLMPRHSLERIASDCNVVFTINVAYEPHQNSVFAFFMFNLRMLRRLPSISLSQSLGS